MAAGKTPKGTRTKNRIINSSIILINEKGFQDVTLNDICTSSNVAPGTFYHYFSSTNDILKEVLRIEGEEFVEFYSNLEFMPALQKLDKVIRFQLDYYEKKGKEVVSQIYKTELLSGTDSSGIDELLPFQRFLNEIITEGQTSGEFSTINSPEEDAVLIISLMAYYSFRWIADYKNTTLEQLAYTHISNIIKQLIISG